MKKQVNIFQIIINDQLRMNLNSEFLFVYIKKQNIKITKQIGVMIDKII